MVTATSQTASHASQVPIFKCQQVILSTGEYAFEGTVGSCNQCPPGPLVVNQTTCATLLSINETSYAYSVTGGFFPAPFHLTPQFLMTCSGIFSDVQK